MQRPPIIAAQIGMAVWTGPAAIDRQTKHGMVDLAHTATAEATVVVVLLVVVMPAPRAQAQALNATWT